MTGTVDAASTRLSKQYGDGDQADRGIVECRCIGVAVGRAGRQRKPMLEMPSSIRLGDVLWALRL